MKFKILIGDGDSQLKERLIKETDFGDKFDHVHSRNGFEILQTFHRDHFDLIILDVDLKQHNGFEVLRELRQLSDVPLLVVTDRFDVSERLKGFELGADDYIPKSAMDPAVLMARINRSLQRFYGEDKVKAKELIFDGLVVDILARLVTLDGTRIAFRPKEFDTLLILMQHKGQALSRDRILDVVWGVDYFGDSRVVDSHIKKVRKKLGPYSNLIRTVFGVGYKFQPQEKNE